jgi:hypothetical protein
MAQRLAGDIFTSGVVQVDDPNRSILADYFPEFRDFSKPIRGAVNKEGPRSTGGLTGTPSFGGFKPLQKNEAAGAQVFGGFKPTGYAKEK